MKAGKIILIALGSLAALVALALLAAGGAAIWAHTTQRDADGYYTTGTYRYATDAYAIATEGVDVSEGPDWVFSEDVIGRLRIRATGADAGTPVFVGIGPSDDVAAYLAGVEHDDVTRVEWPLDVDYTRRPGAAPATAPGEQPFWVASVAGSGGQDLVWEVDRGNWTAVAMNADGSSGVTIDADAGARLGFVLPVGIGLLVGGVVLLGLAGLLIALGARGAAEATASAQPSAPLATATAYSVALAGRLETPSRWLWLVKWLLVIPHWIVLAFLWLGFVLATVIAFFSILLRGRYPRDLFAFNVGVLRWTWRVGFYSYSALATDRYPPFTLGPVPDYPATLDVAYPERLSRGRVLVKSWLLAIPHLLIVALLNGGWGAGEKWGIGGVIGLLALVAGLMLLFAGRYPPGLFDILMGLNRWTFRVIAYVALMRDEYPPFRLDMGPDEPPPASAVQDGELADAGPAGPTAPPA